MKKKLSPIKPPAQTAKKKRPVKIPSSTIANTKPHRRKELPTGFGGAITRKIAKKPYSVLALYFYCLGVKVRDIHTIFTEAFGELDFKSLSIYNYINRKKNIENINNIKKNLTDAPEASNLLINNSDSENINPIDELARLIVIGRKIADNGKMDVRAPDYINALKLYNEITKGDRAILHDVETQLKIYNSFLCGLRFAFGFLPDDKKQEALALMSDALQQIPALPEIIIPAKAEIVENKAG